MITLLNESNFKTETADGLVLVDFYTDWCRPCKALAPILEELTDIKVCKVNTDTENELAASYNVSAIPCLVFLKDGVEISRMTGLVGKAVLQNKVDLLNEKTS